MVARGEDRSLASNMELISRRKSGNHSIIEDKRDVAEALGYNVTSSNEMETHDPCESGDQCLCCGKLLHSISSQAFTSNSPLTLTQCCSPLHAMPRHESRVALTRKSTVWRLPRLCSDVSKPRVLSSFHAHSSGLFGRFDYLLIVMVITMFSSPFLPLALSASLVGSKEGNLVMPTEYMDEKCDDIIGVGEVGKGRLELTRRWPYNEDMQCEVTIMAPVRQRLLLRWAKMDLFDKKETLVCEDRIFVYDGKDDDAILLTPPTGICGREAPSQVRSVKSTSVNQP